MPPATRYTRPETMTATAAVHHLCRQDGIPVIDERTLADLRAELGGANPSWKAWSWIVREATICEKPILVTLNRGRRAQVIAPQGWTQDRLSAYVALHAESLKGLIGDLVSLNGEAL